MDILCIEGNKNLGDKGCAVAIPSAVSLFILKYCDFASDLSQIICHDLHTDHVKSTHMYHTNYIYLNSNLFAELAVKSYDENATRLCHCVLPAIVKSCGTRALSGLGCVSRGMIKSASLRHPHIISILGFKQACLKACAEVSAWTKFCEVEMPDAVSKILFAQRTDTSSKDSLHIPEELIKLEHQFKEPVTISNISKRRRLQRKLASKSFDSSVAVDEPGAESSTDMDIKRNFVEGPDVTLADLLLFPCVSIILNTWKDRLSGVVRHLPETLKWYSRVWDLPCVKESMEWTGLPILDLGGGLSNEKTSWTVNLPTTDSGLCTIRDAKKKKFKASSAEINRITDFLKEVSLEPSVTDHPAKDFRLSWRDLPDGVHPKDGDLPAERLKRKCEQLENLASIVLMLAKPGNTIVDFCSGGGHLAILLAYMCPDCQIILVENKEESICKAEMRIKKLGLRNVYIYQCNLDYFHAPFDVGVCLHACGVATDLVMHKCLKQKASFVICPCCYGGIQNTHTMTYPRSAKFKKLCVSSKDIQILGHAADQTEFSIPKAVIGKRCMEHIDNDRRALAVEHGYTVTLSTLDPPSCSPKNNLLCGATRDWVHTK